ncbi:hypothetical protein [Roseicella sp. DB1501]|uniref:DUF1281 family ferredoxin-like fold protein n=1 Tax=Roseicella sp. DB1501 TaxID=2730925 RepID=UPI001491CD33|nr:hypothetical protein [Roseicella sp. DB1501]NOG70448.1 hypothetical protein [Roseicella sp. DB1501]
MMGIVPNHVTTRCTVTGPKEEVDRFRALVIHKNPADAEEPGFDFEAIIPMPACIKNSESSSTAEEGMQLIIDRGESSSNFRQSTLYPAQIYRIRDDVGMPTDKWRTVADAYLKKHPGVEEQGKNRMQALLETGHADWYSWSIANWGTKWNSYSFSIDAEEPLSFRFDTAWNFPTPVFEKLAADFPGLRFDCVCFDEGWNFAGRGCFNPGPGDEPFDTCDATDALYERVYGHAPERDDEDEVA